MNQYVFVEIEKACIIYISSLKMYKLQFGYC